jgi:hypothetical protein
MSWPALKKSFDAGSFADYLATITPPPWCKFVTVHNTGAPDLKTYLGYAKHKPPISDVQWMGNLEGYYKGLGWNGGPHLFITPNYPGILVFNDLTKYGTHSPSWNRVSIGVEIVGDFDKDAFSGGTKANVIAALAALHSWLGLDPSTLRFHKEDTATTHKDCPGKNVVKSALISAVRAAMGGGAPVGMADISIADGANDDHPEQVATPAVDPTKIDKVSVAARTAAGGAVAAPVAAEVAKSLTGQVNDIADQVTQTVDKSGNVIATTKHVIAVAKPGFWNGLLHTMTSPEFLIFVILFMGAAWAGVYFWQRAHKPPAPGG